jgi:hypothetical protein
MGAKLFTNPSYSTPKVHNMGCSISFRLKNSVHLKYFQPKG